MQTGLFTLSALCIGAIISIYFPMNSAVSRYMGSPLTANISFFVVALLTSILLFVFWGETKTLGNVKQVPSYLFLTGVISAFIVLGTTFLIPQLGARKFFILTIAGQIVMAMIVSHFGVLESPKDPVTIKKIVGAVFLFIGAIVSTV
jgi:bacterial/archaeal transporter family-2 protein